PTNRPPRPPHPPAPPNPLPRPHPPPKTPLSAIRLFAERSEQGFSRSERSEPAISIDPALPVDRAKTSAAEGGTTKARPNGVRRSRTSEWRRTVAKGEAHAVVPPTPGGGTQERRHEPRTGTTSSPPGARDG